MCDRERAACRREHRIRHQAPCSTANGGADACMAAQVLPEHLVQPGLERLSRRVSWVPPVDKARNSSAPRALALRLGIGKEGSEIVPC